MMCRSAHPGNRRALRSADEPAQQAGSLPEDLEELPQSVVTGRTVKDLKRSAKAQKTT
jgi:hypothetical protein